MKCPNCGSVLSTKNKRSRRGTRADHECLNPKCKVIAVRLRHERGSHKIVSRQLILATVF